MAVLFCFPFDVFSLSINTAFHSDFHKKKKKEHDNTLNIKKTINIALNFDFALFCFFNSWWVCSFPMHGLPLCLWVVWKNSSLIAGTVITLPKNFVFSSIRFEMSAQISWRFFFLSLVKSFETTCAQTFVICIFSCSTCHIVSLLMDILSAISQILSRRSSRTIFSISRLL